MADCAVKILESLNVGDINTALEYCSDLADMKWYSVFLIRQLSYITNRYQLLGLDDNEILRKIDYIKQRISISRCPFIESAVTQLSNLRTSHITTSKRIYEINRIFNGIHIAKSFIKPIPNDKLEFESVLSDYFSFSLFDSYLYLMKLLKFNLSFIPTTTVERSLEEAYERISAIQFNPENMYKKVDEDVGYYFLRESFLFSEQPNALQFQIVHGYYYLNALNSKHINQLATPIIEEYFSDINELEHLNHTTPARYEIRSDKYNSSTCGMLENSTALVYVLGRKQGQLSQNEQDLFVELMSYTREIGEICPKEYLASMASSATCQRLQLVVNCLITLNHKSQLSEHKLRSVIQDYCIQQFNGNLNDLVQYLYSISPAVAEHLLLTCDETFLATLFRIVDRPVDAIQLRADMLNWYGELSKEDKRMSNRYSN